MMLQVMENCNFNLYDYEGWDVTTFKTYDVIKSTFIICYERVTLHFKFWHHINHSLRMTII